MGQYGHLTLREREDIMVMRSRGESVRAIARAIGRDKSTVSRELARNRGGRGGYRASAAQAGYLRRRDGLDGLTNAEAAKVAIEVLFEQDGAPANKKLAKQTAEKLKAALLEYLNEKVE